MPQQATVPIPADASVSGGVPIPSGAEIAPDAGSSLSAPTAPQQSTFGELIDMGRLGTALTFGRMLGLDRNAGHLAYQHQDEIEQQLRSVASDFDQRITKAATVKDDPLYMFMKKRGPEPFESHDMLENFIHDVSEFIGDPVQYGPALIGGLFGGSAGARVGTTASFTIDAGLRKALADHYTKGTAKTPGEITSRVAAAIWEASKGAAMGEAMHYAEMIPGGKQLLLRGLYQSSAMTVAGDILNLRMPSYDEFQRNAVTVTGLNLITHAATSVIPDAKQGLIDVYAKDGTTPDQSAVKLQAQPPVKPEQPEGLQPAIRLTAKDGSTQVIVGQNETHSELAERVTGERPVTIEELEANPKLADKVLNQPEIHEQSVIDKAFQLKEDIDPGEERYANANLKSSRGFAALDGKYLNRSQAKNWVKSNEPEVHQMWLDSQGGDEKAEFHSQDYMEARKRVADRTTLEGDPKLTGTPAELNEFLAKNRESLNKIKAGNESDGYGKSVIRTTFTGPRNMVRAQAEQVAGKIAKLVPDYIDQEALSFMRDYRDDPDELRAEIENVRNGDNEKLKQSIPSMERALAPTPAMLEADKQLTDYFTQANQLRTQFVGTTSAIDPSRYSPRLFAQVAEEEEAQGGVGRSKFSKRSPHDIRREYLRILDPLKSGEVEARTFNAVDELRVYGDRLATSVARSTLEMELKNSELGKHGIPGQIPFGLLQVLPDPRILSQSELEALGAIPKNWVALPGTEKTIVTPEGKQIRTGLQVPPKVAEAMKPILENDVLSGAKYWKAAKLTQAYIKSIELGLSPFHMRALTLSFMNNAGIDAYQNALASDNRSPEFEAQERKGALYGLTTTKTSTPYEAYQGLKPSSIESRNTLLAKAKTAYEPIDAIFKGMTKATFEVAQRKFKVIDFSTKEAQWLAKNPNATDAQYGTAMRSIAKEVNAVYGGLNWEVMGVSSNFQAIGRMFLLAPDWTFSNVANLKYAGEGGPGGKAARAFWIKSFATAYVMTQGMSLLLTGQPSKQPFNVYLGKDDKGKEMYSSIFLAGAPKDAVGLVTKVMKDGFPTGAIEFSINKASPLFGTGSRMLLNKDWQGKPIMKQSDSFGEKTGKELGFGAEQLFPAPFVVKDMTERFMNPDESLSYKDFIAGLVGAPVYHEGAKQPKGRGGFTLKGTSRGRFKVKGAQ